MGLKQRTCLTRMPLSPGVPTGSIRHTRSPPSTKRATELAKRKLFQKCRTDTRSPPHAKTQVELIVQVRSSDQDLPQQGVLLHVVPENKVAKKNPSQGVGEEKDDERGAKIAVLPQCPTHFEGARASSDVFDAYRPPCRHPMDFSEKAYPPLVGSHELLDRGMDCQRPMRVIRY